MPTNYIYDYQALIAGIMALVAGALGFVAAVWAIGQQRKANSARQTNFNVSIVAKLRMFEFDVSDLYDAFSYHEKQMMSDPSYYPDPDSFDTIRLPVVFEEIWKVDVGLPEPVIVDIEKLTDLVSSARDSIARFESALKEVQTPTGTPQQNEQHKLVQLVHAARNFVCDVQKYAAASADRMINHFGIDKGSIDALWRKQEDE